MFKETFSEEERKFLENLIYPTSTRIFDVDDAFGIFIGFQIDVSEEEKALPTADFRKLIRTRVDDEVSSYLTKIQSKIIENSLQGHNFYIYVLPFTDINSKRKKIMEAITK